MQLTMPDGRPTTIATGARNEELAARVLAECGYVIVERNFKTKIGELDIIARDGPVLCFVEVRSRADGDHGSAADTVNHTKRLRVSRMAQLYIAWRRPEFEEARFDVVAITGRDVELIRDAWRLGDRA
jgi:putative endonuclease